MPALPDDDANVGEIVADVVNALGETVRSRLELVEEKIIGRARHAGVAALGAVIVSILALAAWACGMVALGLWLRGPLHGAGALGVIAGIHVVIAGIVAFFTLRPSAGNPAGRTS